MTLVLAGQATSSARTFEPRTVYAIISPQPATSLPRHQLLRDVRLLLPAAKPEVWISETTRSPSQVFRRGAGTRPQGGRVAILVLLFCGCRKLRHRHLDSIQSRSWHRRRHVRVSVAAALSAVRSPEETEEWVEEPPVKPLIITDVLARSFLSHFNNAFLNTIEKVRTPHLERVISNLKEFAARVPSKYRGSIQKALRTEGFLSFLLARASLSLLCAKATVQRSPAMRAPALRKEHEELATVVEELYIAAMLHAEKQWDVELKADGKTFMAVATSFVRHLTEDISIPLKQPNIQNALLGFDANPIIWTQYGLDLLGISFDASFDFSPKKSSSEQANWKVSLLGGDSLYATAQWAMANLDSRECRKLIAKTIATYSDGQLRKKELLWNMDMTIHQYLDLEKNAGVAAFFGASSACAALVNEVDDEIAEQVAEFGFDVGLIVGLLKDTRTVSIRSALKLGRMSAPIIFAARQDSHLRKLLESRAIPPEDFEDAALRVKEHGMSPTMRLVNRLASRAVARLECLEDSEEKEALKTLTLGIGCLPLSEVGYGKKPESPEVHPPNEKDLQHLWRASGGGYLDSRNFELKVENLRLRALMQRLLSREREEHKRLEAIRKVTNGTASVRPPNPPLVGLGLNFDVREIDWLLLRGLERRVPLPERLELDSLLWCVAGDQVKVQLRLLELGNAAESQKLKSAVREVFSAGGKRLRPALCLLVHRMLRAPASITGGASDEVLTLATAIEVIHTASLLHDDILDDADTRRQRKTVHRVFGPDVAVLSGDFLFAHASGLIESLEDDEVTRLVSLVIEQFGHGELSQSAKRFDTSISLIDYMKKSFYKTASLLAAACRASAVLSGPPREVCDVMYTYGFYLGIAFQIADDVLDFAGSDKELGKPLGQDLREGLLTAPVLLCLSGNEDLGMQPAPTAGELRRLILRRFQDEGDVARAVQLVREGGGIEMAYQLAEQMAKKALEALMLVAPLDSDARRALAGLTKWAVKRTS